MQCPQLRVDGDVFGLFSGAPGRQGIGATAWLSGQKSIQGCQCIERQRLCQRLNTAHARGCKVQTYLAVWGGGLPWRRDRYCGTRHDVRCTCVRPLHGVKAEQPPTSPNEPRAPMPSTLSLVHARKQRRAPLISARLPCCRRSCLAGYLARMLAASDERIRARLSSGYASKPFSCKLKGCC